jgi:DNA polymerase I-like protein with 3'-5' exonuclease and polymerase domains
LVKSRVDSGDPFWVARRKETKRATFALQYGAGTKKIAEMTGWDIPFTKKFIYDYYVHYPKIKKWQDTMMNIVTNRRVVENHRTVKGFPAGVSTVLSTTGRLYTFVEYDDDYQPNYGGIMANGSTKFSRNEVINYPIQGFAGGDLTQVVLGELYYELQNSPTVNDYVKLVNTVHDSIVLDVSNDYLKVGAKLLKTTMESAGEYLKNYFSIDFNVPLRADITYGSNLEDQIPYKF